MQNLTASESSQKVPLQARSTSESAAAEADPLHARILKLTSDLGNTVLTKRAAGDLFGIKNKFPEQFTSVALFRKVMLTLERHTFRLQVRRFVIDLFDKNVMRRIVLDDDSGDKSPIDGRER